MAVKKCPNCDSLEERGRFCSQCGYDLFDAQTTSHRGSDPALVKETHLIVGSSQQEYGALRFVSSLLIFMGWVVIVFAAVTGCIFLTTAMGANSIITQSGSPENIIGVTGVFGAIVLLVVGTGLGLGEIAAGQMILLFLDIRNDVHRIANKDGNS